MASTFSLIIFSFSILIISARSHKFGKESVTVLDEGNWGQMLKGEWMVEFFAPWCPACKALQPTWDEFHQWGDDLGINVAKVDVTTSPGLSGRFMVTALPTIFHVKDGVFRQYRGGRDKNALISFIEDKKWEAIEPVPSWKSPGSIQMSVVAHFFTLSTYLRSLHTSIVEDYGIPTWGSYAIFATATIFAGAILGLLLVFIIDCICPPASHRPSISEKYPESDQGDEDDDLIDEGAESGHDSRPDTQTEDEEESQVEDDRESQDEKEVDESNGAVRKRRSRKD